LTLSDDVYRQVRDRLMLDWVDGGEHEVKNIARPVRVWHWSPAGSVSAPGAGGAGAGEAPLLPDKPSIVVLPFDNMSNDPEQDYFADGLTEDIITELSRFAGLFVIARNTAFTYKGEKIDVPKVAAELGVHFVVEGSVRKAGERLRITAQLIDGVTGNHVWADRYDGKLEDVFDLQEDVTRHVMANIAPQIDKAEFQHLMRGERRFDEAHDLAWRATAIFQKGITAGEPDKVDEAIELALAALALNDQCAVAYQTVCWAYTLQNLYSWGADPAGAARRAMDYAQAAMKALPQTDTAYICLGVARFRGGDAAQAVRDFRRAHELNPNDVRTLFMLAWAEATLGETEAARQHVDDVLRLSPKDIWSQLGYLAMTMAAFLDRDHDDFVDWAQKAIQANPVAPIRRALMIAYAADVGDDELLKTHIDALNSFAPDFVASLFRGENRAFAKDDHMALLLDGLRKAGLGE
jgi:TolB-like protein